MQTRTPSTAGPKVGDPVRVETIQRALEMAELDAVVCTLPQHAAEAYQYLATPDAFLGLGSDAVTAILAAMGSGHRVQRQPWMPVAMGAKVLVDTMQAGTLPWQQWVRHRACCFWCVTAAAATFASVPLAIPEAYAAVKCLWGQGRAH
jgi:uncharacterized membrane protein